MGDETRQITNELKDTIMGIYNKVGDIAITQAVIQTKQDATYGTVGRIEEKVNKINSRVDSLESTRDKDIGKSKRSTAIKKSVAWILGIISSVIGLAFVGYRIWG